MKIKIHTNLGAKAILKKKKNSKKATKTENSIRRKEAFLTFLPQTNITMAMTLMRSSLRQKLSSQIHLSKSLIPNSHLPFSSKVSDRIVKLAALDPDGKKHEVVGLTGQTLLKALTNTGLIDPASHRLEEIDACSAECEVNIAQKWLDMLPPRSYDEEYILKRSSRARVMNTHSRLACQVVLTPELQGMIVAVPEPKPWDIP